MFSLSEMQIQARRYHQSNEAGATAAGDCGSTGEVSEPSTHRERMSIERRCQP